jgi:hypothetical protein
MALKSLHPMPSPAMRPGRDHYTLAEPARRAWTLVYGCWAVVYRRGRLRWIIPRDSWLINRATVQPAALFGDQFWSHGRLLASCASVIVCDVGARVVGHQHRARPTTRTWPTGSLRSSLAPRIVNACWSSVRLNTGPRITPIPSLVRSWRSK